MPTSEASQMPLFARQYRMDVAREVAATNASFGQSIEIEVNPETDPFADKVAEEIREAIVHDPNGFIYEALKYTLRKRMDALFQTGLHKGFDTRDAFVKFALQQEFGEDTGFMSRLEEVLNNTPSPVSPEINGANGV